MKINKLNVMSSITLGAFLLFAGNVSAYEKSNSVIEFNNQAVEAAIATAEANPNRDNIAAARALVNAMRESSEKDLFQDRVNAIMPDMKIDKLTATANVDVYIISEAMLSISLNTNSITFEGFSGVEDVIIEDAVRLTVNSSLPYEVKTYLESEISNEDNSLTLDSSVLNIKTSNDSNYKSFVNTSTPVVLVDNAVAGNDKVHSLDVKLTSQDSFVPDVYRTTVKVEVNQK
jgi:hypothetical protein